MHKLALILTLILALAPLAEAQETLETLEQQQNQINLTILRLEAKREALRDFSTSLQEQIVDQRRGLQGRIDNLIKMRGDVEKKMQVVQPKPQPKVKE